MVHLIKLAVGIRDLAHLRAHQAQRAAIEGVLRHHTRTGPRRADELTGDGSIYWVVAGILLARQRVTGVDPVVRADGSAAVALVLHPELIAVSPRAVRPFQGWRYLQPADAPADLDALTQAPGEPALPEAMRRDLLALALL